MADAALIAIKATLTSFGGALSLCPIPALQYIPTAAVAIINIAQTVKKNKEDAEELATYIGNLSIAIWGPLRDKEFHLKVEEQTQLVLLQREMERVMKHMEKLSSKSWIKRVLTSADAQIKLVRFKTRIQTVLDLFNLENDLILRAQVDSSLTKIDAVRKKQVDDATQKALDRLRPGGVRPAKALDVNERICIRGTRTKVLNRIGKWINDSDEHILWVKGVAGSGKSTLAATVAARLRASNGLGGEFAFSREDERRNEGVLPELSRQLASWNGGCLKQCITEAIEENRDVDLMDLSTQFEVLMRQPLQRLPENGSPLVIVLDALDECKPRFAEKLIHLIGKDHAALRPYVKFVITSRVDRHLSFRLEASYIASTVHHLALDEEDSELVEGDIKLYLQERLPANVGPLGIEDSDWPGDEKRGELAQMAQGLFVWIATAVLYIADPVTCNPKGQLAALSSHFFAGFKSLNDLYGGILSRVFPPDTSSEVMMLLRFVLGAISVARTPVNINTLTGLLSLVAPVEIDDVPTRIRLTILAAVQSVLITPGIADKISTRNEKPIRFLHTSFVDFLITPSPGSHRFIVVTAEHHERMAKSCLICMRSLKRNICGLHDPSKLNSEVEGLEKLVDNCISPSLRYACRYWSDHVALAPTKSTDILPLLTEFLQGRLLYWIEALSLMGQAQDGISMIGLILQWLRTDVTDSVSDTILIDILLDIRYFLYEFMEPIGTSAMHIYLSAFPFVPSETLLARHDGYRQAAKGGVVVLMGLERQWPQTIWVGRSHISDVSCLAFSPDGTSLASGSTDTTIRLWDAQTGTPIGEALEGHSEGVSCLTFSRDGTTLASGSRDRTLRLWDRRNRVAVGEALEGHSRPVTCLAFSPNGTTLASGSWDQTLRLWDAKTGASIGKALQGHSGSVNCLAFSPNGTQLASGSWDNTLWRWDAKTGASLGQAVEGHSGSVNCLAFYPDGTTLVSGSGDKTLRLWDAETGASIIKALTGHSESVTCVTVSPNGTTVASGSQDNTLRLWDAKTGTSIGKALNGHSESVSCLAFSPDGTTLASGSRDKTLRLWDAKTGGLLGDALEGHSGTVTCLAFSPDGTILASGSEDSTIRVWSAKAGTFGDTVRDHSDSISSLAFSPDGNTLAAVSWDNTLRLWNAKTGASLSQAPESLPWHSRITNLTFSLDSTTLAADFTSTSIVLWDVQTGMFLGEAEKRPLPSSYMKNHARPEVDRSLLDTQGGNAFEVATYRRITKWDEEDPIVFNPMVHTSQPFVIDTSGWIKEHGCRLLWLPPRFRPRSKTHGKKGHADKLHAFGNRLVVQIPLLPILDISALKTQSRQYA